MAPKDDLVQARADDDGANDREAAAMIDRRRLRAVAGLKFARVSERARDEFL